MFELRVGASATKGVAQAFAAESSLGESLPARHSFRIMTPAIREKPSRTEPA